MAAVMPMVNGTSQHQPLTELSSSLRHAPHQFLQPTRSHQQSALAAAKAILDPLANDVAQAQIARRNENRRKRKRGSDEVEDPVLQLRQIYTKGLGVKQVWEQARRVLDAAYDEVERGIEDYLQTQALTQDPSDGAGIDEALEDEDLDEDEEMLVEDEASTDGDNLEEVPDDLEPEEDIEAESIVMSENDDYGEDVQQAIYKPDPNNLNDGFFSIDDFNKQSQFLEQMDANGDDDNPTDEDEIEWDADPLAQPITTAKSNQQSSKGKIKDVGNQESESEEDGPTFGNVDLNADISDEDMNDIDGGELNGIVPGLANTNEVRYADFFEPPPKKPSKSKRTRALPKTQPPTQLVQADGENDENADVERAIADVRRDLLDSEEEDEAEEDDENEDDLSDDDNTDALPRPSGSKMRAKNLSTHEKQQIQIADEIRRLESLNVSKKPWTLSGEASASARPMNSLIEEDLDFERTGKPVPVITAEVSNDIEALIKRRILARDFDEVVRRMPTATDSAADARRGRADTVVDDTKPTAGLGELYESEYQRNADPSSYVDRRSAATKKQHDEIDKLWKEVRDQLDVLGNLHMKPKRAEVEIKTVEDKPRIAMEDARPAVSGVDADGAMLAPQEIYKPGTDSRAESGEVLSAKTGASRSKEEMTREEKMRKRRREKERQKKASAGKPVAGRADGGKKTRKAEQEGILKDLEKGGVRVIGKGGEKQDLSAKKRKGGDSDVARSATSGGALKL
ncbi:U3 snoRNP protein [Exophiala xenobiotica]|uniref:U3 small nucleolar ribonucleoprotein protein MPP10 n=1 Tax=Lithohypha guttulata TaxID=1690604 RepID=A0ABR0KJH6_9EURO|nr:U3 snoRNP protein [Lithohypha guttulata]KAK5324636.1 U3 snoRNP protein [Exophiala xenobiotica]